MAGGSGPLRSVDEQEVQLTAQSVSWPRTSLQLHTHVIGQKRGGLSCHTLLLHWLHVVFLLGFFLVFYPIKPGGSK